MMDFEKRFDELKRATEKKHAFDQASAFLDFHLEWAQALEATDPEAAIRHYLSAEGCQATIGSFASGSGEGLESMTSLYRIMGRRADALVKLADMSTAPGAALGSLGEALAIWSQIKVAPNGLGDNTPAAAQIDRLKSKMEKLRLHKNPQLSQ